MPDLMAARRDASWFRKPGRANKYHVVVDDNVMACAVHTPTKNMQGRPVAEFTAQPAEDVPAYQRCQRPGCRVRWPKIRSAVRR